MCRVVVVSASDSSRRMVQNSRNYFVGNAQIAESGRKRSPKVVRTETEARNV